MKMSVGDWFKIYVKPDTTLYGGAGGTGGTNGNGDFFAYLDSGEDARLEALEAEHRRITQMIAALERFNVLTFVDDVKDDRVTKGCGASNGERWRMAA